MREVVYPLPLHRVFEDRVPRLADLDGDGRDEIIVVESDAIRGAALVVLGLRAHAPTDAARDQPFAPVLLERARSPYTGAPFRWLNPVGVADFDGDGRLDIASVTTPHIGGVLTLHRFRPPVLEPYAKAMDVSNHRMGALEQSLAAIVEAPGHRPTVIVPIAPAPRPQVVAVAPPRSDIVQTSRGPVIVERGQPTPSSATPLVLDARIEAAISALMNVGDTRALPFVARLDALPRNGCGRRGREDCQACTRTQVANAMRALAPSAP